MWGLWTFISVHSLPRAEQSKPKIQSTTISNTITPFSCCLCYTLNTSFSMVKDTHVNKNKIGGYYYESGRRSEKDKLVLTIDIPIWTRKKRVGKCTTIYLAELVKVGQHNTKKAVYYYYTGIIYLTKSHVKGLESREGTRMEHHTFI